MPLASSAPCVEALGTDRRRGPCFSPFHLAWFQLGWVFSLKWRDELVIQKLKMRTGEDPLGSLPSIFQELCVDFLPSILLPALPPFPRALSNPALLFFEG